jgi:hypothetical protein
LIISYTKTKKKKKNHFFVDFLNEEEIGSKKDGNVEEEDGDDEDEEDIGKKGNDDEFNRFGGNAGFFGGFVSLGIFFFEDFFKLCCDFSPKEEDP